MLHEYDKYMKMYVLYTYFACVWTICNKYKSVKIATNKIVIYINNNYSQWLCPFIDVSCKSVCLYSNLLMAMYLFYLLVRRARNAHTDMYY